MRRIIPLLFISGFLVLAGCGGQMQLPKDFVEVEKDSLAGYDLRAVSAEGVVLAVRTQKNPSQGSLAFWTKAITSELTANRGYELIKTEAVTSTGGLPGRLLTFKSTESGMDFSYLLAAYVEGDRVLIAEAGGKADAVKPRIDEIKQALLSVK